ncbi:MAG: hypothetical protein ABI053_04875 [Lacisediminihabitans sp.]
MSKSSSLRTAPGIMPVLSAGKHRSPRSGACFMEFASWLAGESWSDRPACTHPALASLARLVNDCSTAGGRTRLIELIPSVIGLVDDDPLTSVLIAIRATSAGVTVARDDRQRALATGLLCFGRFLEAQQGPVAAQCRRLIDDALLRVPAATAWALKFSEGQRRPRQRDLPRICEAALRVSVVGIAEACIDDPDTLLYDLLSSAIADLTARTGAPRTDSGAAAQVTEHEQSVPTSDQRVVTLQT